MRNVSSLPELFCGNVTAGDVAALMAITCLPFSSYILMYLERVDLRI